MLLCGEELWRVDDMMGAWRLVRSVATTGGGGVKGTSSNWLRMEGAAVVEPMLEPLLLESEQDENESSLSALETFSLEAFL
jgi:hypothetical protein